MDSRNAATNGLSSSCDTGVTRNKTIGQTYSRSPSSHITPGQTRRRNTHHSSCSWGANHEQHGKKERRRSRQSTTDYKIYNVPAARHKILSDVSYELELPAQWKIHPVIHANLLTPYKETALHGPNFTRPPPDLIDGEEEYEAEEVQKVRRQGRGRKLHYLVKWKGFPTSDSTWEPVEHLKHAPELI